MCRHAAAALLILLCSSLSLGVLARKERSRLHNLSKQHRLLAGNVSDQQTIASKITVSSLGISQRKPSPALTQKITDQQQLAAVATALKNYLVDAGLKPRVYSAAPGIDRQKKGIVVYAGSERLMTSALVLVKVIRQNFQSDIPIDVMYYSPEERDETLAMALTGFPEVTLRDTQNHPDFPKHQYMPAEPTAALKKIFALYFTGFEEVLLLDADSQPLVDPSTLFSLTTFEMHGSLFWPACAGAGTDVSPEDNVYKMFGLEPPWVGNDQWLATDSAQLLFDRLRHADVLEWLMFLNVHSAVTHNVMHGDVDTFALAFALANKAVDFQQMPYWTRMALSPKQNDHFHILGQVHNNKDGEPLFLHRRINDSFFRQVDADDGIIIAYVTTPTGPVSCDKYDAAIAELKQDFAVVELECPHLDSKTVNLVKLHDKTESLKECGGEEHLKVDSPTSLIPVEWFGIEFNKAAYFSFSALMSLRGFMLDKYAQQVQFLINL